MQIVLSPAKTLDYESALTSSRYTQPRFLEDSCRLVDQLKGMAPHQLSDLMQISNKLGELNASRYQQWQLPFTPDNARQALLAFRGDVYEGLAADRFTEKDLAFAQDHLKILSGLYGILRPLDLMQPYRLEMGTRLANERGKDLYAFWRHIITPALQQSLNDDDGVLINLASNEYFQAVDAKQLQARIITPQFKDLKNGQYKMISFFAKKARGRMAAWMIQHRVCDPQQLLDFDLDGYRYSPEQSQGDQWLFLRGAAHD